MMTTDLVGKLTDGVRSHADRAGVIVLTALSYVFGRFDVVDRWYRPAADGVALVVDWHRVVDDVDTGAVPLSDGERAALRVAASMAAGVPANLRDVFGRLDEHVAAAIIAGVYALSVPTVPSAPDHHRFSGQADR